MAVTILRLGVWESGSLGVGTRARREDTSAHPDSQTSALSREQRYYTMAEAPENGDASDRAHHVYIVECSDGTYYTGYTTDVTRRVAEHNEGAGAKYTRGRRPVQLVHEEAYGSRAAAMRREYAIKQLSRPAKERLVRQEG